MSRKRKIKREGYDLYLRTSLYNSARQKTGEMWTLRTSGHTTTDLEMAEALTQDLTRMGIQWRIRNQDGEVVQSSEQGVVV